MEMENEITQLYFVVRDLGAELGRVFEGGPDWKVVREKAKELQELATKALAADISMLERGRRR
jgi:hypothetical protein